MTDVVDEIYKAIEITIQRYISKMKISQHVNGVVVGESKKSKGKNKYRVKVDGEIYDVKDGLGIKPAPNSTVWVTVPNGDWSLAFICAGRSTETGFVTEEALNSTRAALEQDIQDVYDACVSGGAVLNPSSLGAILNAGNNISITETTQKLTIAVTNVVTDVRLDGTSVVSGGIANLSSANFGRVKDVTVDGSSVVNSQGVAVLSSSSPVDIPVEDVRVNGTSVVNNKIANIDLSSYGTVKDVKVSGVSVVNSSGIANVPSFPVTDVWVDGSSVMDGTIAKITSTGGSTVTVTPLLSTGTKIATIDVDQNSYDLYAPNGGGTGNVEDVYVNGTSVLDSNHIAQIDLTSYTTDTELQSAISTLQASFQDGVDAIYNACVRKGSTPASHSLADVIAAIYAITSTTPIIYEEIISETTLIPKFESTVEEDNT